MRKISLFCSYAPEDESIWIDLQSHLKVCLKDEGVEAWSPYILTPGAVRDEQIAQQLARANIILFLVSVDLLKSDELYKREIQEALQRHARGDACVIPIIVRDVVWDQSGFRDLEPLPKGGKPVSQRPEREWDNVWADITRLIRDVVREWRERHRDSSPDDALAALPTGARAPLLAADEPRATLRVRVVPPIVGVRVVVTAEDGRSWNGSTTIRSAQLLFELPAGKVRIAATFEECHDDTMVRVQVHNTRRTLAAGEACTVMAALPYSLAYSTTHQRVMQLLADFADGVRRHWLRAAVVALLVMLMPLGAELVYRHVTLSNDHIYVPPIPYNTGLGAGSLAKKGRAYRILGVLSNLAQRRGVSADTLARAAFSNPPHKNNLKRYYLDKHEVTVEEYDLYLRGLPEVERKAATPGLWLRQKQRNDQYVQSHGGRAPGYPVHSVLWEQANRYCQAVNGRLPSGDEWEVVARNLLPSKGGAATAAEGTLYPWGDDFLPKVTRTAEAMEDGPAPVCTMEDKTKQQELCDLGGNLREWTSDEYPDERGYYYTRGSCYADNGELGAMGYTRYAFFGRRITTDVVAPPLVSHRKRSRTPSEAEPSTASETGTRPHPEQQEEMDELQYVGFRCAFSSEPTRNRDVALINSGEYELGSPPDPRFSYFAKYGGIVEFLLQTPQDLVNVGDFFMQPRKVSIGEYQEFLQDLNRHSDGHGPFCQPGEPRDYRHNVLDSDSPKAPVTGVSWYDARAYCAWRGMRLPTAVEWERVVRGDRGQMFPWGELPDADIEAFLTVDAASTPAGRMLRNMWSGGGEWTNSKGWGESNHQTRVVKGVYITGFSNKTDPVLYVTTVRYPLSLDKKDPNVGIRCVVDRDPTLPERILKSSARMSRAAVREDSVGVE